MIGGTSSKISGGKFANGANTGAFQFLFNQAYDSMSRRYERRGPIGPAAARPAAQQRALFNTLFSGIGAGVSGWGCVTTGTTCGLALVLSADAYRQYNIGMYGSDPVKVLSRSFDLNAEQANSVALATDFVTATISINGAWKGVLTLSGQRFSSGTAGVISSDVASTINTVEQLSDVNQGD